MSEFAIKYLRSREYQISGVCPDCWGADRELLTLIGSEAHPIGHRPDCPLAKALESLGCDVMYREG